MKPWPNGDLAQQCCNHMPINVYFVNCRPGLEPAGKVWLFLTLELGRRSLCAMDSIPA